MPRSLCPFAAQCGLSRSIGMEAALHVWESFYCEGSHARCERFRLHLSGREVPRRLMPNGRLLESPENTAVASSRNDPWAEQVPLPLPDVG